MNLELIINFTSKYMLEIDIVKRCTMIHDFFDEVCENRKQQIEEILVFLLSAFNSDIYHLSEIKTVLVISKPFRELQSIKNLREKLLETYNKKKDETELSN